MDHILEILKAFIAGAILGGIFMALKLPIPAPQNTAGIFGIIGIFTGFLVVKKILE